jgi:hypothetical protein
VGDSIKTINPNNKKREIRSLKNEINYNTQEENIKFIGELLENHNPNTLKNFSILLYLNFYNRINRVMGEVLRVKVGYYE